MLFIPPIQLIAIMGLAAASLVGTIRESRVAGAVVSEQFAREQVENQLALKAALPLLTSDAFTLQLVHPENDRLMEAFRLAGKAPEGFIWAGDYLVADTAAPGDIQHLKRFNVPSDDVVFLLEAVAPDAEITPRFQPYFVESEVLLSGLDVMGVTVDYSPVTQKNGIAFQSSLGIELKEAEKFKRITQNYMPGGALNPSPSGRQLAIIAQGEILLAPIIQMVIADGRISIAGQGLERFLKQAASKADPKPVVQEQPENQTVLEAALPLLTSDALTFQLVHPENDSLVEALRLAGKAPEGFTWAGDYLVADSAAPGDIQHLKRFNVPSDDTVFLLMAVVPDIRMRPRFTPLFVETKALMTGRDVADVTVHRVTPAPQAYSSGGDTLSIEFKDAEKFKRITENYKRNGALSPSPDSRRLAFIVQGEVLMAPSILFVIEDGRVGISGLDMEAVFKRILEKAEKETSAQ